MKAVGAKRSSNSLMLEEAGRGDCLEEGPASLHRRVEMSGLPGVSVQLGAVSQESNW